MTEVAFTAKYGAENMYKCNADINMTKGSSDSRIMELCGKEPKGYLRAISCPTFGKHWHESCESEVANLRTNNTFELMPLWKVQKLKVEKPTEVSLGYTHFVNKCKTMDDGYGKSVFDKLKSRLVYQGELL